MKPSLQLKLGHSLTITPQLQQAIRLLQLSSMELHGEIQDALDSNMMLELDEGERPAQAVGFDNGGGAGDAAGEGLGKGAGDTLNDAALETAPEREAAENEPRESETTEKEAQELVENNTIPAELPVDTAWDDIYDGQAMYAHSHHHGRETPAREYNEYNGLENQGGGEPGLREQLLWQLNVSIGTDADRAIATAIIDALDDDGYLTCSVDDIHAAIASEDLGLDEVEAVLRMVQALEPTGVGARDLKECLELQLRQLDEGTPHLAAARVLVSRHLPLLAAHDYKQLMRRLQLDDKRLAAVIRLIQSLNPRPGEQLQPGGAEYIVPDVYVSKIKGRWKVELNTEAIPQLRINRGYANMVRRSDNSAENASLKTHLQEARWFIKSLKSRGETLLRVATSIIERQRAFLEYGEEAMKPLVLGDIAADLGLHESTISRVTMRKYLHTPRGLFELKYFFSSHVHTEHGGVCSSTAIRALIKKLIRAEPPHRPLSDSKLAALLAGEGIKVARRTVAKYRELLAIPPSKERKRLGAP